MICNACGGSGKKLTLPMHTRGKGVLKPCNACEGTGRGKDVAFGGRRPMTPFMAGNRPGGGSWRTGGVDDPEATFPSMSHRDDMEELE